MRRTFLLKTMLLLCALVAGTSSSWAGDVIGTINFGSASGSTKIEGKTGDSSPYTDTGNDSQGNTWTITTVTSNDKSFTQNASYSQVGASSKPATSITFTTTLQSSQTIKAFSAKFGGFSGTAGTVTLKVGDTTVGTGSLNAANDVTVEASNTTTSGTVLTVTVTGISKGVKCYYISYTYEDNTPSSNVTFTNKTPSINFPANKTYSQDPTTAAGYSGTITYSITSNTAGATINSSTGLVTVTGGGSVTVKATASATTGFVGSEDTYTLTVNDTRSSAGLAWSAESANVQYGADNNIFPTLTNPHSVPVTYTSSNKDAATINGSGVITLMDKTATTQISAIFEGNDDYLPQTVSYTLNVTKGPFSIKDGVFDFVEAAAAGEDYGSGVSTTTSSSEYVTTDKTWTAGNVTMVTSKVSGSGYRWWSADGTLRFYNKSKATFSVPNGYVITKIVTTGASFDEANIGTLSGSTWTGASKEVALSATATRNIQTITVTYCKTAVTITSAGWASFSSGVALDFTGTGVTAYIAKAKDDNTVTLTEITKVPANTGIVVNGSATTHNIPVLSGDADATTGNLLKPWLTAGTPSDAKYYILSVDGDNNPIFKKSKGGTLAAGKSYLVMSANTEAPQLSVDFGEGTTNLEAIRTQIEEVREGIFDLSGRRVENPTKGLYIVNGKKVVIK